MLCKNLMVCSHNMRGYDFILKSLGYHILLQMSKLSDAILEILKLIVVNSQYYTLGVTMHCQRSSDYGGTWPGNTFCFCNYYF